jgi:PAS domain S-box-containing protein
MLAGTGLFLREFRRARPRPRRPTPSLLVAHQAPRLSKILYISRLTPPPIDDLTPFALTLTGVIFAWNLFRWRMLDSFLGLVPLARDTIVTLMPDAVLVLDPQGRVIDLNPAARELLGQPVPRLVGRPVVDALAGWPALPLDAARVNPVQMEVSLQRPSGRHDFDLLVSPLRQERGDPVGYLVALREMTERKRAQEALLVAHQQVVGILESMSDAFCALDATWHVTYVNHQAEALWGRRRADLLGRQVWAELPRLVDGAGEAALRTAAAERRATTFETLSPLLNQWLEVNAYPNSPGLAVYFRDITARKQAEQEREAMLARQRDAHAQAEAATRLREEFLAIASHELRTPLTVLRGYVQLLHRHLDREPPNLSGLAAAAGQITRQVSRFEALVNDLLDVSRFQQGQVVPRRNLLDLADLARQTLSQVEHLPERTPQHRVTLDAPAPVLVSVDADRLEQVLTNLLSNAMKYSPRGGQIRVGIHARGDQAELTVGDEGIGIPLAEQPTLFQPFSRTEGARRVGYGTGLGLYITARIVEQHGGTIGLTSEPGTGTTVTVRLPLASP